MPISLICHFGQFGFEPRRCRLPNVSLVNGMTDLLQRSIDPMVRIGDTLPVGPAVCAGGRQSTRTGIAKPFSECP